jgi:hypothetical protein
VRGERPQRKRGGTPHEAKHSIAYPARILPDFSQRGNWYGNLILLIHRKFDSEKSRWAGLRRTVSRDGCTKSGHRLVDGLHSIENTRVAGGDF